MPIKHLAGLKDILVFDGLALDAVTIIDSTHIEIQYHKDVEISEADAWREKFPEEFVNLDDEQVLAKIPTVQEANDLRLQYGEVMNGLLSEAVLAKRDELVEEASKKAEALTIETAKKAEEEQALKSFVTALQSTGLTPDQIIEKLNS